MGENCNKDTMITILFCNFCTKHFKNDQTRDTHHRKYHSEEFTRNGLNFTLNPQTINNSFLAGFNTSICNKSLHRSSETLESSKSDLIQTNFQTDVENYLKSYHSNLSVASFNINSQR